MAGRVDRLAGAVIGVVGGSGGVGASTFAAVLAAQAPGSVLVDLDETGGGIDVLLGIEAQPGARWSQLRVAGGEFDAEVLARGLPRWGSVPVLAADVAPPARAAPAVVRAASTAGPAVLALARGTSAAREAALATCQLVVVLGVASVRGLAAGRAVVTALGPVRCGLVLRRGEVRPAEAVRLVGVPLLGQLPRLGADRDLVPNPTLATARLARVATGVLDGLGAAAVGGRG